MALSTCKCFVRVAIKCACSKVEKCYFIKCIVIKHFYTFRLALSHLYI